MKRILKELNKNFSLTFLEISFGSFSIIGKCVKGIHFKFHVEEHGRKIGSAGYTFIFNFSRPCILAISCHKSKVHKAYEETLSLSFNMAMT